MHGDLFDNTGFLDVPKRDILLATDLDRVSILRFIALGLTKTKIIASLDHAIFDPDVADQLHAEIKGYRAKPGVDIDDVFNLRSGVGSA